MIRDLNKIFELWKGKVGSKRTPNPKSAEHQYQLREILNDLNWDEVVINELLYNLSEADADVVGKNLELAKAQAKDGQTYSSERSQKVYTKGQEEESGESGEKGVKEIKREIGKLGILLKTDEASY